MTFRQTWLIALFYGFIPSISLAENCTLSADIQNAENVIVRLSETDKRQRRQQDFDAILLALRKIGNSPRAAEMATLGDYVENRVTTVIFLRDGDDAGVQARLTAFPPFSIVNEIRAAETAAGCPEDSPQKPGPSDAAAPSDTPGTLKAGPLGSGVSIDGEGSTTSGNSWVLYAALLAAAAALRLLYRRTMRNRRANVRHFCNFPATIHPRPGSDAIETKVVDFSIGGAKIRSRGIKVTAGEAMTIAFEDMVLEAHVAWIRRRHFGVRFVEPLSDRVIAKLRTAARV